MNGEAERAESSTARARPGTPGRAVEPARDADASMAVLARVRLRARRRASWVRALRALVDGSPPLAGVDGPAVTAFVDVWDDPEAEALYHARDDQGRALGAAIAAADAARNAAPGRLARLAHTFGLDEAERDYVEACLAAAIDPSLGPVLAEAQDHPGRSYPTEPGLARLFGCGPRRVLVPASPLCRWGLLRADAVGPGEPEALSLDPLVRDWLMGDDHLDEALVGVARVQRRAPELPEWPVDELAAWVHARLAPAAGPARLARLRLVGAPGCGRRTLAAAVAARLGLTLLVVDADQVGDDAWPRLHLRAERQAFLDGCALAWVGESLTRRRWPEVVAPFPVQFVVAQDEAPDGAPGVVERVFAMPPLSAATRGALWRAHVPAAANWTDGALQVLARQHRVTVGELAAVAASAPATPEDAAALVRAGARHRLGELARWVECPFGWDDLVVPEPLRRALEDLVFEATERAALWEEPAARRLFPQGRGLFALFSGPPGIGKTMAAQVVAARLGVDLFRISLATVVSKYVGETSKNIQRLLSRAAAMDAVLLFDEADALFGKRTEIKDAHDRFANTDTDHLLQAMEGYEGVAILSTNKKANLDGAFTRRLRYVLEFPRPDAEHRRRLWQRLVAELAGDDVAEALAPAMADLAARVEATGAQIKYAVLTGVLAARRAGAPLALGHLLHGLARELGKEGRALDQRDRERMERDGR